MANFSLDFESSDFKPLAARMRSRCLQEYIGQTHLLAPGKPLFKAIATGQLHSMILWGPPGTGKTTLAEMIALQAHAQVERLSAVNSGVKDIRDAIERAKVNQQSGVRTVLFVDEVHRFNKSQQDAFLPFVENGTVTLIGATTENPSFELNSALLSRARIYLLKSLTQQEIEAILTQAMQDKERGYGNSKFSLLETTRQQLAEFADGDARRALNLLELLVDITNEEGELTPQNLQEVIGERSARFDNKGDRYYDCISAVHKSIRGSAPDAALYWYARILTAGGDPLYVARRLLAIASEDIGNADPRAMQVALAAFDCFTRVGPAEGERAIAQAIIYLALAPKSNAVHRAFSAAVNDAKNLPDYDVPEHLRNAPTKLMKNLGYGVEYRYAHNEPHAYAAGENYFPAKMSKTRYYYPSERGAEKQYSEKLTWLILLDEESNNKRYVNK